MKKTFTLFAMAGLLAATSFAAPQKIERDLPQGKHNKELTVKRTGEKINLAERAGKSLKSPARENVYNTPIENVEGEVKIYDKKSAGIYLYWGAYLVGYEDTFASTVVYDGNDVYFKNIFSMATFDTYVKGTLEGNTITVELPQSVYLVEDDPDFGTYAFNVQVIHSSNPDDYEYEPDFSYERITFTIEEDGSFVLDLPKGENDGVYNPEYALGLVYSDDDMWIGYADFYQTYAPFEGEPVMWPEGLVETSYALLMGDYGYPVYVGFEGEDVYLKGLTEQDPELVVQGTLVESADGSKIISVPQNQYLGNAYDHFIYTKVVYYNPEYDTDPYADPFILSPDDVMFELNYDEESGTITQVDQNAYLCFNATLDSIYYLDILDVFSLTPHSSFAGTPQAPTNLYFEDYTDYYGYWVLFFTVPVISEEGNLLDAEGIYYSLFINDNKYEFEEHEGYDMTGYETIIYSGVLEPTTLIPLWFSNGNDIYKSTNVDVELGIYVEGMDKLGVETTYIFGGETKTSEIAWLILTNDDAGVDSVNEAEVSSEYFTLQGLRINNPDKGVFVKRSVLSDGTVVTRKVRK